MKIISVVGARPNLMRIAAFIPAIDHHNRLGPTPTIDHVLVHTGQHYDEALSMSFFGELGIPHPVNRIIADNSPAPSPPPSTIAGQPFALSLTSQNY